MDNVRSRIQKVRRRDRRSNASGTQKPESTYCFRWDRVSRQVEDAAPHPETSPASLQSRPTAPALAASSPGSEPKPKLARLDLYSRRQAEQPPSYSGGPSSPAQAQRPLRKPSLLLQVARWM